MEYIGALVIIASIFTLFLLPSIFVVLTGYYAYRFAKKRNAEDLGLAIFLTIITLILW